MAKDVSDTVREVVTHAAREAIKNMGDVTPGKKKKSNPLSGPAGIAAGAGLAALVPLAKKGVDAVRSNGSVPSPAEVKKKAAAAPAEATKKAAATASDRVGAKLKETVSSKVDEAGGAGGLVKEAASGLLPGGGGDSGGSKGGVPGVGKGRRMPVQQWVDVAVPIETAYNQWTQFEDWPTFMHRVTNVSQEDDCTVSFSTKIWTRKREFTAKIETQRPDERIKWRVSQGITHTGVVTFHELAPRLTRIELTFDVDPGSLIEKAARGMRHVKRAARADLHRYKAFIEMAEEETGAWRGVIEEGELVEEHDPSYDEEREYSDIEDFVQEDEDSDEEQTDEEDEESTAEAEEDEDEQPSAEDEQDEDQQSRSQRFKRQAESSRRRGQSASRGSAAPASPSDSEGTSRQPSRRAASATRGDRMSKSAAPSRSRSTSKRGTAGSSKAKRAPSSASSRESGDGS